MIRFQKYLVVLIFLTIGLSGCSQIEKIEQPVQNLDFLLNGETTIGQTFVARFDGLSGVTLFLKPEEFNRGDLIFHLRESPEATTDIRIVLKPIQNFESPGFYKFNFSPLDSSKNRYYYFFLESSQPNRISLRAADGNTYINGALYQNHVPQEAQLFFGLIYDPRLVFFGLLKETLNWLKWSFLAFFLFVLPGWGLLGCIWKDWRKFDWMEKLSLSIGLSLSIYPLLVLWTNQIGLHLSQLYAWIPPLLGIGLILIKNNGFISKNRISIKNLNPIIVLQNFLLILIIVFVLITRFWAIRNLDAPMWGDSYQHTMITQLLLDHGGLFTSWRPYSPYDSFSVHFGFPLSSALFSWISNDNAIHATLVIGQVINCLAIFTLYPLALLISNRNRWVGIGAIVVAGLLSPMPAFYVNWGRFAQLAGQVILPVSMWFFWVYIGKTQFTDQTSENVPIDGQSRSFTFFEFMIVGIIIAGMTMQYYRMPIYFTTFVIAWLLIWGLFKWRTNLHSWLVAFIRISILALFSGIIFFPRLIQIASGNLNETAEAGLTTSIPLTYVLEDYRTWINLTFYLPNFLIILTLIALIYSIYRKNISVLIIFLWFMLLSSIIAGQLINLPGSNLMQSFAILIAIYIPASLICGWLLGEISKFTIDRLRIPGALIIVGIFLSIALFGAIRIRSVAQPASSAFVNRPDSIAMRWIRKNISKDSLFLVEGYRTHNGNFAVGSDSGWWIPLLAKRDNTMPPQYALISEIPHPSDYSQNIVNLVTILEKTKLNTTEGVELLCNYGITHVFIGQNQGTIGYLPSQLFTPEDLLSSSEYDLVYHQDRVYIFALKPNACPIITGITNKQ